MKYYLTTLQDAEKDHPGEFMAVITAGHASAGDDEVVVCDVDRFPTAEECVEWFKRMCVEEPWVERS